MSIWRQFGTLAFLSAALFVFTACEDTDGDGPITGTTQPKLQVDTPSIPSVDVDREGGRDGTITISNSQAGILKLNSLSIREDGEDDIQEVFAVGQGWAGTKRLAQDETLELTVRYKPVNDKNDDAWLVVDSNDPDASTEFSIGLPSLSAGLSLVGPIERETNALSFTGVEAGESASKIFRIESVGTYYLEISAMDMGSNPRFSMSFPDQEAAAMGNADPANDVPGNRGFAWPNDLDFVDRSGTIPPGEEVYVRVTFAPTDNSVERSSLVLDTNVPNRDIVNIPLKGNVGSPCLALSNETQVDFGRSTVNRTTGETITMENCRPSATLRIKDIYLSDDAGGIYALPGDNLPNEVTDGDDTTDWVLPPETRKTFSVNFTPAMARAEDNPYRGTLVIESNDPTKGAHEIELVGNGTTNECPTAVAKASIKGGSSRQKTTLNTLPLETVQFHSGESTDDGSVERYRWALIDRPEDSTARLSNASVADPTLFLDLAGTYKVELTVYDDNETPSCGERAIVTIDAVPQHDVHVQLVWDTPADADENDDDGTDLDLHYKRPEGAWNVPPGDVFWKNKSSDWPPSGPPANPSLDIDDTNGAGPENINQNDPKDNIQYQVGVFYFDDQGFGESYATVRIYLGGTLRKEFKNKFLEDTFDFWHVGNILWSEKAIYPRDIITQGFPGE